MSATEPVNVRVLDREYTVGVESEGREALMSAARLLDTRMREVRGANRMAAVDRVAVLAALNMAHELEQLRNEQTQRERALAGAVAELQQRLDAAARSG